jgi:hypothetical protein
MSQFGTLATTVAGVPATWLPVAVADGVADASDGLAVALAVELAEALGDGLPLATGWFDLEPNPITKTIATTRVAPASRPAGSAVRVSRGFGAWNGRRAVLATVDHSLRTSSARERSITLPPAFGALD